MKRKTHKGSNRYLNAGAKYLTKSYEPRTLRKEKNWERHGLIWRTLATHPKGL
jgi:hypothetical protein